MSKWDDDIIQTNELDIHLAENRQPFYSDVEQYWKGNQSRFPVLAKMARDFLVCQPTGKDLEGNFSKARPQFLTIEKDKIRIQSVPKCW